VQGKVKGDNQRYSSLTWEGEPGAIAKDNLLSIKRLGIPSGPKSKGRRKKKVFYLSGNGVEEKRKKQKDERYLEYLLTARGQSPSNRDLSFRRMNTCKGIGPSLF